jgi:taurine dioxygenase
MTTLKVEPLAEGLSFGARITGVTRRNVRDPDLRSEVGRLFEEHGILVFAAMEPTSEMQVELSSIFGPLREHAMKSVPRAEDAA